jgi:hypothetical protein
MQGKAHTSAQPLERGSAAPQATFLQPIIAGLCLALLGGPRC